MIRCIAVDDEPLALEIIDDFVKRVPFIVLEQKFENAARALQYLQDHPVDLIFLDIKMPDITGIDFLHSLKNPPAVIFTTAFQEYAFKGFELDVVDYLLKPIPFERFLKAVSKVQEYLQVKEGKSGETEVVSDYIFVKTEYKIIKIDLEDILYVEALKDYVKIYTPQQKILTLRSLKSLEMKLPKDKFIRVHRSFLVSLNKISAVEKNTILIANQSIPISEGYRDKFYEMITRNS
ncbi:DNA-binding response regulator [Chitinophaga caeni]|uniref:DNA-binding response regulator n=1 Tax=Chitinophaga caeni TaxID=2029983 RepID=A0A291QU64_9BACT|nr:LytTR family DNA-binding domain-containing protein [Chitinophaga caeni]ATL47569.1 DNA-binding response regulator [Chitinophaga caeni]